MNLSTLPKVILREMLQYVSIKDRLALRLTCRAFAKLVAETNAGYYDGICAVDAPTFDHKKQPCENLISVHIGGASFHGVTKKDEEINRILYLRNLLFRGIVLESFRFELDDSIPFAFVRKLVRKVKIRNVHLIVNSGLQLEHAHQLITDYKESTLTMELLFRPKIGKLLMIPPMTEMKIALHNQSTWSLDLFLKLLAAQPNLTLEEPVEDMTLPNLERVVQLLSAIDHPRRVRFRVRNDTMSLSSHGIDALVEEGNFYGEFEIVFVTTRDALLRLGYQRCLIELKNIDWKDDEEYADVYITNCDAWWRNSWQNPE